MEGKPKDLIPCSQPQLSDLFPLYISGNVAPDDRIRIEEHLAECEKCQNDVRYFLDLQSAGRELIGDE
jgi:anti-sigma factor RsiW